MSQKKTIVIRTSRSLFKTILRTVVWVLLVFSLRWRSDRNGQPHVRVCPKERRKIHTLVEQWYLAAFRCPPLHPDLASNRPEPATSFFIKEHQSATNVICSQLFNRLSAARVHFQSSAHSKSIVMRSLSFALLHCALLLGVSADTRKFNLTIEQKDISPDGQGR
jgi:hypothetical protein